MMKQKVDHRPVGAGDLVASIGSMRSQLTIAGVIGHVVIWLIISCITLGIGAIFWPYAAAKLILDSIIITDEYGDSSARLNCSIKFSEQLGHAIMWLILILLTGGMAAPFYLFAVAHVVINRTALISA